MKIPPFFLGATILFWGYEKNLFILGIVLSLLIEGGRFSKTCWQLNKEDYIKISDLTSVLLLATIALIVMNYKARYFLLTTTGWLPLILLPLILAQIYGADEKIIIGTQIGSKKKQHMHRPMNFSFAYAIITLFAASSANSRHEVFFPLFFALIGWLLMTNRGKTFSPVTFFVILILAFFLGFSGIKGLEKGFSNLQQLMLNMWDTHFQNMGTDPFKDQISFGDIGRLKLSGKIIMRLQSSDKAPTILKEAGYNVFSNNFWFNRDREFTTTPRSPDENWKLVNELSKEPKNLHIEMYFPKNKGLLPLPYGTEEIRGLNIVELTRNNEGVLRFEEGEILQSYNISYIPGNPSTLSPSDYHLLVPVREDPALQQVIDSLDLSSLSSKMRIKRIQEFFHKSFSYSLRSGGKGDYDTALANFLLHRKSGYCELFATSTTLLLRKAGIPSRYITGYAVAEKSFWGQEYIVRLRHAHAWTEAYINGEWTIIDTTPSNWLEEESNASSFFEPICDFFSFIKHQINLFRISKNQAYNVPLSIAVILLTAYLIFRIYRRLSKEKKVEETGETIKTFQRQDSPFTMIEEVLNNEGPKRWKNESFHEWLNRINAIQRIDSVQLTSLHRLHQKLRFDPHGIGEKDMAQLQAGVKQWLRQHSETVANFQA